MNPLPVATAVISGPSTICQNDANPSLTFTGLNGSAPYTFTYNINGGPNQTIVTSSGNSVALIVPTNIVGTFVYTVTQIQDASSTACFQSQNVSASLIVNPLPTATITGTTTVCQNDASPSITFTGSAGTAPYTFIYNLNGGANQTITTLSGNSISLSVPTSVAGTYSYTLVSVSDASATNCIQTQTGSAVITVNPLPTASISGTTTVCNNDVAPNITFTGAAGTAPYTFTYKINGGPSQTITTAVGNSVTVSVPTNIVGTYVYSLVSVKDASLTQCNQLQIGSATIIVNPLPTATILGSTIVCQNEASPLITFTGSNGTAPYTFTYNINGGVTQSVSTIAGNSITVSAPTNNVGIYIYNLVSVSDASATSCSQSQTGSATINVNPLPLATISGTTDICQNDLAPNITFTGSNGTAPYTFIYKINGGVNQIVTTTSGNSVNVSVSTAIAGTFVYSLVSVTDASATSCTQTQTGIATVKVNPLPTASVSGTTIVCNNDGAPNITFTGSNGSAPYTFTYNINGGASQTVTTVVGNSVTVAAPTNIVGNFNYNLVSVSDASSTTCVQLQSGSALVTVNPLPIATISGSTTVCESDLFPNVTFTGSNGIAPYTFIYTINGGASQTVSTLSGNSVTLAVPTSVPGTFIYSLVSVSDASATNCNQTQTGSATIQINPLPSATLIGGTTVCNNDTGPVLTFTGSNGTAPYTFTYSINGGVNQIITTSVGNSVTLTIPTNVVGTFVYSLVSVKDASLTQCVKNQNSNTTVVVNPLPTATISGTTTVCQNNINPSILFTGSNGTAPYTFTYKINGGINQTVTTISGNSVNVAVPTNTVGTYNYSLISVSDASATNCNQLQSGLASVIVNPLPTATISGDVSICKNDISPNVSFTGANGTAPYTFTYRINGGSIQTISTTTSNTVTVSVPTNVAGTFVYSLIDVKDASATTCNQNQSGIATVVINQLPNALINGTTTVCQDAASPNITFTGSNGVAPYTFTYKINGGPNQSAVTTVGNSVSVPVPTNISGSFTYTLVSVQDASSTSCSQAQVGSAIVTVNSIPTATLSGTTIVCQNEAAPSITFTGANGTAPYVYTYSVNGGPSQQITSLGSIVSISAPTTTSGTFVYTVTNVRESSFTTCSQAISSIASITVNPLPTAAITGTTEVCQNDAAPNVIFTGANGTAPYTFSYKLNNGIIQNIVTTVGNSVSIPVPTGTVGTYTYSLVSVHDASSTSCSQIQVGSAIVNVNPLPTASIAVNKVVVCQDNTSPVISFTGSNGTAPYIFTYSINGGTNKTVSSVSGNVATLPVPTDVAGTFVYSLISVQDASASRCIQNQTGTVSILINPTPNATLTGSTIVCQNDVAPNVTFTGLNGTAPYTFTYKLNLGGNQIISTTVGNTAQISVPTGSAGNYDFTLLGIKDASPTGCTQTLNQLVTVNVNPLPIATISGTTAVCQNDVAPNVTFTGLNGTAPYTFTYKLNGGIDQQITTTFTNSVSIPIPTNIPTTYTYTLVSVKDGSPTSCSQAQTGTATVVVNPIPVIQFNPDVFSGCAPLQVEFTNSVSPASDNLLWNFGDGSTSSLNGNPTKVKHTYTKAGCYDISLIATKTGCKDTLAKSQLICVYPRAVAQFSVNNQTVTIVDPTVSFINFSDNSSKYNWIFNDGTKDTLKSPLHTFPREVGNYTVNLIANNSYNCPDTATFVITVKDELVFYVPNAFTPDNDNSNQYFTPVFSSGYNPYEYTMYIFNRWGELIFETHDVTRGWNGKYGEDGDYCQDGMYVWKILYTDTVNHRNESKTGHVILLR